MVILANGIMSQTGNSLGRSLLATSMARRSADGLGSAGHAGAPVKLHPARIELATFSVLG
jgi:hypothetical protein